MTTFYNKPLTIESPRPQHAVIGYWYNGRVERYTKTIFTPDLRERDVILDGNELYRIDSSLNPWRVEL